MVSSEEGLVTVRDGEMIRAMELTEVTAYLQRADFPCLIVNSDHQAVIGNESGTAFFRDLGEDDKKQLGTYLNESLSRRAPASTQMRYSAGEEIRVAYLIFLPLLDDGQWGALLAVQDVTLEANLRDALVASRRLFKDLVSCSGDFAWETDGEGRFTFVSVPDALGYSARELNQMRGRGLLLEGGEEAATPFESRKELKEQEVRLRAKDGSEAIVMVSCLPVTRRNGEWIGTRGICRDVTEDRRNAAELARVRERASLIQEISRTIYHQAIPADMLQTAVSLLANAVGCENCWVYASQQGEGKILASARGQETTPDFAGLLGRHSRGLSMCEDADGAYLIADCSFGADVMGFILVARREPVWSKDDRELITSIANQVGVVMTQANMLKQLENLARVDELTGFLNRRAFYEDAEVRLGHRIRTGNSAGLLYIDLDNFKAINDTLGHSVGDELLRRFSSGIASTSRVGDIIGRMGGDEFVLWLEEVDENGLRKKISSIFEKIKPLESYGQSGENPLGLSIGAVLISGEVDLALQDLINAADEAMYDVKKAGKGNVKILHAANLKNRG